MQGDDDQPNLDRRYREQSGSTGNGSTVKKLAAAVGIAAAGYAFNRSQQEGEKAPPPPPPPARLIPNFPVHSEAEKPDTFALNVRAEEQKLHGKVH